MAKGSLYIVTAPSGAGKTSLVRELIAGDDSLGISVSHTTRPKREGERDGVDYFFVSPGEFRRKLDDNDFLEHAEVYGHHYGTSRDQVSQLRDQGLDVILEIDWQGADQVRRLEPGACSIFILPPSIETLRQRLETRALDASETIDKRMGQAQREITQSSKADYVVINDDFDKALAEIRAIIHARRLRREEQAARYSGLS